MDTHFFNNDSRCMYFDFNKKNRPSLAEFLASIDFSGVEKINFYCGSIILKSENDDVFQTLAFIQTLGNNSCLSVSYACFNCGEKGVFEIHCVD